MINLSLDTEHVVCPVVVMLFKVGCETGMKDPFAFKLRLVWPYCVTPQLRVLVTCLVALVICGCGWHACKAQVLTADRE